MIPGPTPPQLRALYLSAREGLDHQQIAARLNYSPLYVEKLLAAATAALGATNRAHAVSICYERGLFTADIAVKERAALATQLAAAAGYLTAIADTAAQPVDETLGFARGEPGRPERVDTDPSLAQVAAWAGENGYDVAFVRRPGKTETEES